MYCCMGYEDSMKASKVTAKYQATIPTDIRRFLGLQQGDAVGFEIQNNQVVLKKLSPLDLEYIQALAGTLSEWSSPHDEEAYGSL